MSPEEMKEISRAKAQAAKEAAEWEESEDDDQVLIDLNDARILLEKCKTLLCYVADPDLCKSVTQRERTSMERMKEKIGGFLTEMDKTYSEEREEA